MHFACALTLSSYVKLYDSVITLNSFFYKNKYAFFVKHNNVVLYQSWARKWRKQRFYHDTAHAQAMQSYRTIRQTLKLNGRIGRNQDWVTSA